MSDLKFPTVEDISQAVVLKRELMELPEIGWKVYAQELTGDAYLELLSRLGLLDKKESGTAKIGTDALLKMKPFILANGLVREDGSRILTEQQASGLSAQYQAALMPCMNKIVKLSNMSSAGEAKKNLKNAPSDASFSKSRKS